VQGEGECIEFRVREFRGQGEWNGRRFGEPLPRRGETDRMKHD
jgi:hypothetical protein